MARPGGGPEGGWRAERGGWVRDLPAGRRVWWRTTGRADGDLAVDGPAAELAARRAAVAPGPWTWLRQVHGREVVVVRRPGEGAGRQADAAVSDAVGAVLAVHSADCAPVALWSPQGVVGAVHAGWRGLVAGVLERTVEAMGALGARDVAAVLGPCIHACCYEFGADDLAAAAARLGPTVAATTSRCRPALDLVAGVRVALASVGVDVDCGPSRCTADDPALHSHRARADRGRQALVIRLEEAGR